MSILVRDEHKVLNTLKIPAIKGKSAYEIACGNGFKGTEKEWLNSLQGENGSQEIYVGKASEAPKTATMVIDLEDENEYDGFFTDSKYDYLGKAHSRLKEVNDSNIEHVLRKVNVQKYEGSSITANNSYMKQVNNVILKGVTKFKDLDTGDFVESFEEGRNLELVGSKGNTIRIKNKLNLQDLIYVSSRNNMSYNINNNTINLSNSAKWGRVIFNFDYQPGVVYNITFVSNITGTFCIDFNKENSNRTIFSKEAVSKDFTPSGEQPLQISNIDTGKMQLSDFYICKAQHKNEPYKSSQLILPIENPLYSIGDVYDYIDFKTGLYVKNIGIRRYQEGDESNSEVLTDKKNTIYKLEQPIVSKIDLQGQKIYSYDGTTYYTCQSEPGYPSPILSMEVPTDLASLVQEERAINKQLYNDQNIIINSQLSLYEAMSVMLLEDNNVIPQYIQDLYELAYERGIRSKEQEDI